MNDVPRGPDDEGLPPTPPASPHGRSSGGSPGSHEDHLPRRALEEAGEGSIPEDAIHDPDDPVLRLEPPSVPLDFERVMRGVGSLERTLGEVSVTGMGHDPHLVPDPGLEPHADPHVAELSAALERLRRGLASRGEAALRVDAEMSRFDATLRAYCVGYLAGRRADDPNLPPPS